MPRGHAHRSLLGPLALVLTLAGCALDLDRLRAGAGDAAIDGSTDAATTDGGREDGGPIDGGDDDGGDDGGVPPRCECGATGRWQRSSITFPGTVTRRVTAVDLDRDGDVDFVATVDGGPPVAVVQLPRECESPTLDLFPIETHLPESSTPVAYDADSERPLGLAIPQTEPTLLVHQARGRDATYSFPDTTTLTLPVPARTVFSYDVTGASGTDLVLGTDRPEFFFLPRLGRTTGAHDSGSRLDVAAFQRVSGSAVWLFGGQVGGSSVHAIRFVDGVPSVPASTERPGFALSDVVVGDIDSDGNDEALYLDSAAGLVLVRRVSGSTTIEVRDITILPSTWAIAAADLDGDGAVELVGARRDANDVDIYDLEGETVTRVESITLEAPASVLAEDVDGDGWADLIVGHALGGRAAITVMRQLCR